MPAAKLHKSDIPHCVAMRQRGLNDKDIAAYIGVAPETFSRWINDPKTDNQRQLSQELKKAQSEAKTAMLETIMKAAKKTWQAAAWWLERKYPDEFAKPEVQLQREAMMRSTEQLLEGIEGVTVSIREAAMREHRAD